MSGEQPIVQHLNPNHEDSDEEEFLAEADALEIVEVDELQIEGADDEMDEDEAEDDSHEMDESNEPVEGGEQDGAEMLLENGFDDSVATYEGHQSALFSVALHPISPLVAISGGADDMGHIWRTDTGEVLKVLDGHTDSVTSVAFNFDGEMVATGGMDGLVRIWQRVKGSVDYKEWEFLIQLEGPDEVNWIDWHPKGNLLLSGGADGTVWLWQLPTGNAIHVLSGHINSVTCGRFTPDGKKILTASEDSTLILWDPRTGEPIHKLQPQDGRFRMTGGINSLTINPTSTVAICGGASGGIRAVNLIQGTVLAQMKGHEEGSSIESIQFSEIQTGTGPKSVEVIVSVGTDARVCIWEAGNFKLRSTGLHEDAVTSLAFPRALSNPHAAPTALNTTFITASADKTLKLWDYRTGLCLQTFLGHSDAIHSCAISSDGKIIVSGGEDGLGKSFEVGRQGEGHLGNN